MRQSQSQAMSNQSLHLSHNKAAANKYISSLHVKDLMVKASSRQLQRSAGNLFPMTAAKWSTERSVEAAPTQLTASNLCTEEQGFQTGAYSSSSTY